MLSFVRFFIRPLTYLKILLMKKNLTLLVFAISCLVYSNLKAQTFAISAYSTNLCINSKAYASVTTTMAGATTYTWMAYSNSCTASQTIASGGLSVIIQYPCCGVYTVVCWAYNGSTWLGSATAQVTVSCNSASTLTISSTASNGTFCSTSNVTLSANGNTTYTWLPGNTNNPTVLITPTTTGCYTVVATNSSGCFNMSPSYCASVIPTYSIGVTGNTAVCLGNSASLSLTGGPSFFTLPGSITSSSPVLTPSVTTTYTIWCPTPTYACPVFTTETIIVNPSPNISINPSSFTSCSGASNTLVASGAASYTWSNTTFANSTVVSPTTSTCYSVVGQSSLGCLNGASVCLNVLPQPTLSVSGSNTVCLGSSATLTVSGANTYTWALNNSNASIILVLPTNTTPIVSNVYGTDLNGCANFASYTLTALNTCADVWPGDANSDGMVNSSDVFEIGLAFNNTGAARSPGGNSYTSQFANTWSGTVSSGKNKCHADCNGDGIVNNSDTIAIFNNFLLAHSFKVSESTLNGDFNFSSTSTFINEGMWSKVDILLGSSASPIGQVYGVAFDVNFDQSLIETNSAYIVYTASFLNASNQNVQFRKTEFASGTIYAASVRIDGLNVSGNGKIGEFWFKPKTGLPANSVFNILVSNASKIDHNSVNAPLSGGSTSLTIVKDAVGVAENNLEHSIQLFPNPASNVITLQSAVNSKVSYIIFDIVGREISSGEFTHSKTIDLSDYANGTYVIRLESAGTSIYKKIVVEK